MDDWTLLQKFVQAESNEAFGQLVHKYTDAVYAACRRRLSDPCEAQDATQVVFLVLARKATTISRDTPLAAWLLKTARYTTIDLLRKKATRERYEQEAAAAMQNDNRKNTDLRLAYQLNAEIDDALFDLNDVDRAIVCLRYVEDLSNSEIGERLGVSRETAAMRLSRSMKRLKHVLLRRGVAIPGTALAAYLDETLVQSAPMGLASNIAGTVSTGAGISPEIESIIKGVCKMLTPKVNNNIILVAVVATALLTSIGINMVMADDPVKQHTATSPNTSRTVPRIKRQSTPVERTPRTVAARRNKSKRPLSRTSLWTEDTSFSTTNIVGIPIGLHSNRGKLLLPVLNKKRGGPQPAMAQLLDADGTWRNVEGVMPIFSVIWGEDHILQAQPTSDRKSWQIQQTGYDGSKPQTIATFPKPDQATYVHHTHLIQTDDDRMHALAGVYRAGKKDSYVYAYSDDDGKNWSDPVQVLPGFTAHDDLPVTVGATGNQVFVFGYPTEGRGKGAKLMRMESGQESPEWTSLELPHTGICLANFQTDDWGGISLLYGTMNPKDRRVDLWFSRMFESKEWSKPAILAESLKAEDVLMQIPPTLSVDGNRILAAFPDITGSWGKGEFRARFLGSNDGGQEWFEIQPQSGFEEKPPQFVFSTISDRGFSVLTVSNYRREGRVQLWLIDP